MEEKLAESREKDRMKDYTLWLQKPLLDAARWPGGPGTGPTWISASRAFQRASSNIGPNPVGPGCLEENGMKGAVASGKPAGPQHPHPAAKGALDGRKACIHTFFTHMSLRLPDAVPGRAKARSGAGGAGSGQLEFRLSLLLC